MKGIEIILTNCIEEIRSGEATLEECLARHPEMRQELEPLLRTAVSIKNPPAYHMEAEDKQSVRANLLRQIRQVKRPGRVSFADILSLGLPRQLAGARAAAMTMVIALFVGALGTGTAYASQSSVPGDALYAVKTGTESVRLWAAGSPVAKAGLNVEFAGKRLQELSRLVNRGDVNAQAAADRYRQHLAAALRQLEESGVTGESTNRLAGMITEMEAQIQTCDELADKDPVNAAPVNEAASQAVDSQARVLQVMAGFNALRAAEINTGMMQNRLQGATAAAATGRYQAMAQKLWQYRQLNQAGQQILEQAQNTNCQLEQIKAISMQQLAMDTENLADLAQQAPAEYQDMINECEQIIQQFQQRFRYGQEGSGNQDSSPGGNPGGYKDETMPRSVSPTTTLTPDTTNNPGTGTATPTTTPGSGGGDNGGNGSPGEPGSGGGMEGGNSDNGTGSKPW